MPKLANSKLDPSVQNQMLSLEIEDRRHKAKQGVPTSGDAMADTFTNMANTFQGADAKGWGGMAKSLLIGAAGGAKHASLLDRKKDMEKYNAVLSKLSAWNDALSAENQQYEKEQAVLSNLANEYSGLATSYVENPEQFDKNLIENTHLKSLDTYNRTMGTNYHYSMMDAGNPFNMIVEDEQGNLKPIDALRYVDTTGELQKALNTRRGQVQRDKDIKLRAADLERKSDPNLAFDIQSAKSQADVGARKLSEWEDTLDHEKIIKSEYENILDVARNHPELRDKKITRNLAKWFLQDEDGGINFRSELARSVLNDEQLAALDVFAKAYNNIIYHRVQQQKAGRVTNEMLAMDKRTTPNTLLMSGQGLEKTLAQRIAESDRSIKRHTDEVNRVKSTRYEPQQSQKANMPQGIKVKDPETGEEGVFSPQDAMELVHKGGILV